MLPRVPNEYTKVVRLNLTLQKGIVPDIFQLEVFRVISEPGGHTRSTLSDMTISAVGRGFLLHRGANTQQEFWDYIPYRVECS